MFTCSFVSRFDNMADFENIRSTGSNVNSDRSHEITEKLDSMYAEYGLEIYPFKIGWYNEQVDPPYQFSLHPDTLAYVVVSTPDMFENAFLPFICRGDCFGTLDLLDKCMQHYFALAKKIFPDEDIETIHDFEMSPMRRAKFLVQPACHVAGAAYYYTRRALNPDPFKEKTIFGVCIHPKYGGWFGIRGVIIFKSVQCPDLPYKEPVDCVPDQAKRVKLLDLFTNHWKDWRYRDIISVEKRYSEDQKAYFNTLPKDRKSLVMELREKHSKRQTCPEKKNGYLGPDIDFREDNTASVGCFSTCIGEKDKNFIAQEFY